MDDGILISQKIYVEDILKWLKMESSSTFVSHCKGIKDGKKNIDELVNTIYFKGKLESLCYLTFIIPAIVCGVGIIGQFMKNCLTLQDVYSIITWQKKGHTRILCMY